ncbi:uncharacterized protein PV09_02637 [Verruconis gallopava]|uniref:Proteasome maturation factor UMP1 n=1 Tax=Verruconis gallopava TaxID=253628 RepID=A0A0D1Z227_9PEZI|nr:uncharacterized protein PV09_02637 [Verruconis gallopava]KIW06977.1 hypothetical protein PV09_02637 [Verruconis gallopava]
MSLRIVPPALHPSSTRQGQYTGAPSAPGVHDTLRANLNLTAPAPQATSSTQAAPQIQSTHPLEARLAQWRSTQDTLKMTLLGRQFGIAEPVRRGMELQIVAAGEWTPAAAMVGGGAGIATDILSGRDTEIDWEDVFHGSEFREQPDFHTEMEARMRMNW